MARPDLSGMIDRMKRTFAALAALALLSACNSGTPTPGQSPTADAPPAMSAGPTSAPATTPTAASDLVIGFGAVGPAKVGMSKKDALATGLFDANGPAPVDGCPGPPLIWKEPFQKAVDVLTKDDGSIASLGVLGKGPTTDTGIGLGSTLANLKKAYGADLTGPAEAGYGQSGAYVEKDGAWIGFLFNSTPAALKDDAPITFIEVSIGQKPGLMRDGC